MLILAGRPAENENPGRFKLFSLSEIVEKEEVGTMWSRTVEIHIPREPKNSIADCAARMTKTMCIF